MFRVTLDYIVNLPDGNNTRMQQDSWIARSTDAQEAIRIGLADTQTAVEYRFGRQKTVRIFGAHLVELIPCESCKGSGKLASMSGYYTCQTCKGGKYFEGETSHYLGH